MVGQVIKTNIRNNAEYYTRTLLAIHSVNPFFCQN